MSAGVRWLQIAGAALLAAISLGQVAKAQLIVSHVPLAHGHQETLQCLSRTVSHALQASSYVQLLVCLKVLVSTVLRANTLRLIRGLVQTTAPAVQLDERLPPVATMT